MLSFINLFIFIKNYFSNFLKRIININTLTELSSNKEENSIGTQPESSHKISYKDASRALIFFLCLSLHDQAFLLIN